ncbi:MAG TPA: DUF2059 domain-containing protein [Caldimonas sp.]|nr:DUF2059 domain-containing protein [Caldimonas sp.]
MQPRRLVTALALFVVSAGAHAGASLESVERLMQVMKVQLQLEAVQAQALPLMQNAMRQAVGTSMSATESEHLVTVVMPRIDAVVREEISWATLRPAFAAIYADTFTQEEVDGLIAFYDGPIGRSLIAKTPELTRRSFLLMQERMGPLMQRVTQIAREEVEKESAKSTPKR